MLALVASARSASRNATIAARAWAGVRAAATCSAVFLQPSAVRRWDSGYTLEVRYRYLGILRGYTTGTLAILCRGTEGLQ